MPDWVPATPGRLPPPPRSQQVLDLAGPEAYEHVLARLDALVGEYELDYLKWDHNRDLLETVHADQPDPSAWLHGVVSADRRHAVFSLMQLTRSTDSVPAHLQFPALNSDLHYTVTVCPEIGIPVGFPERPVPWLTRGSIRLPGSALSAIGLAVPLLDPAQAVVLELLAD
ncbi:alpha-galactosidase [Embleya scabrispora]|uniref:alpha-galactosidase n=1 Tax=Embleya scabrispora TaxID=159449 RepID=UPI000371A291|nr:alpha-galactosidase [Embleya scabrispora]